MNGSPITCYCSGHCPHNDPNQLEGTCTLRSGGYCFISVQEVVDKVTRVFEPEYSYGCLPPDESGYMQCQGRLTGHSIPRNISCCQEPDLCNLMLPKPMYHNPTPHHEFPTDVDAGDGYNYHDWFSAVTSFLTSDMALMLTPLTILLIVLFVLLYILVQTKGGKDSGLDLKKTKKKNKSRLSLQQQEDDKMDPGFTQDAHHDHNRFDDDDAGAESRDCVRHDMFDSSGGTVPLLVKRTIARDLTWDRLIGRGRYGQVWRGQYRGSLVAIKVFQTTEEKSWKREEAIYNTCLLRHDNILGFVDTDIGASAGCTQMLLITDFHQHGSLYDFLSTHALDQESALRLMHSMARGLDHLHNEIRGMQSKPAIAHRDIKSKNILVKDDLTCCIADFGLSVTFHTASGLDVGDNTRVGTKRYMAPEVLDESLNKNDFESFKRADVYSMSLVMWEVSRRVLDGQQHAFEVVFQSLVPSDPTFEDMKVVVIDNHMRPEIPEAWKAENNVLASVVKLMTEGWNKNPKIRPTARKIKKDLAQAMSFLETKQEQKQHQQQQQESPTIVIDKNLDTKKMMMKKKKSTTSLLPDVLSMSMSTSNSSSSSSTSGISTPSLILKIIRGSSKSDINPDIEIGHHNNHDLIFSTASATTTPALASNKVLNDNYRMNRVHHIPYETELY